MDLTKLYEILSATTMPLRKGETEERRQVGPLEVKDIYAMPHVDDPIAEKLEKIDVQFIYVGIDRQAAEEHRQALIDVLREYPKPDRLKGGPSYIEVGAEIGSQDAALQLFALGKALGLWEIIIPATLGAKGEEARELAGRGFIMITGFDVDQIHRERASS